MARYIQEMVQMLALPHGAEQTTPDVMGGIKSHVPRQEGHQMLRDADGSHAGTAAAVGDAECFVQIQMADIRADGSRRSQADLGIHVRAVHVNLTAVLVNETADVSDRFLKDAVRARISDHERSQILGVLLHLGAQIIHLHIPGFITGHRHDFESRHHGARRIGAMR